MGKKVRAFMIGVAVASLVCIPGPLAAISSPGYSIDEDFIGGGGLVESSSPNYTAQDSIGAPAVGDASGAGYQTQSGATTTSDPSLIFAVNTATIAFGSLSTASTATATATFDVWNYTSHGYVVKVVGSPPSNGVHTLAAMGSAGSATIGTEHFGMNLVANTSPTNFGADPVQVPSGAFSFGAAATGYSTANTYKYVAGDTVAESVKSSGHTTFTASYIANISPTTPGGTYVGTQTFVCIGTY